MRSQPVRIAGNLALDFVNTISFRGTRLAQDHLSATGDVEQWAVGAGLDVSVAPDDLARVYDLRATIRAIGEAVAQGGTPPDAALAHLIAIGAEALQAAEASVRHDGAMDLRFLGGGVVPLLGPVAWAAIDLLRAHDRPPIRMCPTEDCHWLFLDTTRNRSRRWCDMATCGNRAKVARSRRR